MFNYRSPSPRRSVSPRRKRRERSPIPRPTKIHIGHLTRNVTKDHIIEIFSTYGQIKMVDFSFDKMHPNHGRGFAYVEFETADEAENAMKHMDGGQIDGQEITAAPVLLPKPRIIPMRRMSPPMNRRGPMRWGGGGGGGGRNSPPRYRRRSPMMNRRRSPRPPRRRQRSRSRSPANNPRHRHRRYTRSSSSSSR